MWVITESVGKGGKNNREDVYAVQFMLNIWRRDNQLFPIRIDGIVGPFTINAIHIFQQRSTRIADGRVDPAGPSIKGLCKQFAVYLRETVESAGRFYESRLQSQSTRGTGLPLLSSSAGARNEANLGLAGIALINAYIPKVIDGLIMLNEFKLVLAALYQGARRMVRLKQEEADEVIVKDFGQFGSSSGTSNTSGQAATPEEGSQIAKAACKNRANCKKGGAAAKTLFYEMSDCRAVWSDMQGNIAGYYCNVYCKCEALPIS